jgi:D-arabinitol dehydrogenase (NADP+)
VSRGETPLWISTLKKNSLAQMLRQNGGCKVVVAAPQGLKMELAKKLGAGDVCFQEHPHTTALTPKIGICRTLPDKPRGPVPEDQG